MRKYQIIMKPLAAATGEPGRWSFAAHGAAYTKEEADAHCRLVERNGYKTRKLAL